MQINEKSKSNVGTMSSNKKGIPKNLNEQRFFTLKKLLHRKIMTLTVYQGKSNEKLKYLNSKMCT